MPIPVPGCFTKYEGASDEAQSSSTQEADFSIPPEAAITALRGYLRHRETLVQSAVTHIQRMQKALVQMNLQLHLVVTDITGVTGMRILRDIVAGQTDPHRLAKHRDHRCQSSEAEIAAALTGNYRPEHLFALKQNLELFDAFQLQIQTCDVAIESHLQLLAQRSRRAVPGYRARRRRESLSRLRKRTSRRQNIGRDRTSGVAAVTRVVSNNTNALPSP